MASSPGAWRRFSWLRAWRRAAASLPGLRLPVADRERTVFHPASAPRYSRRTRRGFRGYGLSAVHRGEKGPRQSAAVTAYAEEGPGTLVLPRWPSRSSSAARGCASAGTRGERVALDESGIGSGDAARHDAAIGAILTALSMLVGAFIASVAAALGGRRRDLHPKRPKRLAQQRVQRLRALRPCRSTGRSLRPATPAASSHRASCRSA